MLSPDPGCATISAWPGEMVNRWNRGTPLTYIRQWRMLAVELIETPTFTRWVAVGLSAEEYRLLQWQLLVRPDAGSLIPGSGGLRKLRWALSGHGKRGGARVIYYWKWPHRIYLLFIYPKNARASLTPAQLRSLRTLAIDQATRRRNAQGPV